MINKSIWEKKYRAENDHTPDDTFRRVADYIADTPEEAEAFSQEMTSLRFIPGGRILAYAGRGTEKATLSNCYVMGRIEDSMEGIMQALQESALTMKAGGGIGLDFSTLRPRWATVKGTRSVSSGPISFMEMWNSMSRTISGVGDRKGAMIAVLRIDHPDVVDFIEAKKDNTTENPVLEKFNISVGITDKFMQAIINDQKWELKFDGKIFKTVRARDLWHKIIENNWAKAEPGVVFIDTVNRMNNLYYCEEIRACNPCGEQPLPSYGACTLGAINLTQFVKEPFSQNAWIDYETLKETVKRAVRFLDLTVDKNFYPIKEQAKEAKAKRRIGLGVMGLGSMLAMLGVRYGSPESLKVVGELMTFIRDNAFLTSVELANEKGSFPLFDPEKYLEGGFAKTLPEDIRKKIKGGLRNSHLLTIAPTGSIAQLVGNVSGGVEPIFNVRYYRKNYGTEISVEDYAYMIYREKFGGPEYLPDYFVSAHDLSPDEHIRIMAECQKYVDASISKTINLPKNISVEEMEDIYMQAWKVGLKGCTTFREGCLEGILSKEKTTQVVSYKKFERPYSLEGVTYKVKVPENKHAYYLTFTHESGNARKRPVEFFINTKDPSVEEWVKALGRLVSAVFRNVQDPTFLSDEFREIMGRSGFWSAKRRKFVPSLIAEFGEVMRDYFAEIGLIEPDVPVELYDESESNGNGRSNSLAYCRVCGEQAAVFEEGCLKCLACGYNKCG